MARAGWRLQQAVRRFKNRFAPGALILMYHRVIDLPNDPHLLAVSPEHFAGQMEVIRKHTSPVHLQGLVEGLQNGVVPSRAVVITFDDGYADNLYQAKPLLERYEIPATVFVTAGQVGSQREFWWDELDRILLQPGTLPEKLQLKFEGSAYEWLLAGTAAYTEQDYARDRSWHIERKDDSGPRHRLFRGLYERLRSLPVPVRENILNDLVVWAGIRTAGRPTHRMLTSDELILLEKGGLVEAGAHTLTHPSLANLPFEEQRNEIQQGRECLEAILNHPVKSFAYPNGSISPEAITILNELDFLCACSSEPDAVRLGADRFQLPRVVVRDWDRETFSNWLRWWVGG